MSVIIQTMNFSPKTCISCNQTYIPKSGTQKYCKPCGDLNRKEYKKKHRDENREQYNKRWKEWRKNNKEKSYKAKKKWRENNKDRDRYLNLKLYYKYHEQRKAEQNARAKARSLKKKIKCDECQSKKKLHIHHIDEDCFNNNINNLMVLCETCHFKKHGKTKHEA